MTDIPVVVSSNNLKDAWIQTLRKAKANRRELTPFILSLNGFDESADFKSTLNQHLFKNKHQEVDTVAGTIFPINLYKLVSYEREELYRQYMRNLPRVKAIAPNANNRGTYFQRLISFPNLNGEPVNQLEKVITSLNEGNVKRRSKLQASVFDPTYDHIPGMFQGFPCMQHITFYKKGKNGLVLNSFYAMQHLYEKAYGNWLGLVNLGKFIAQETNLELQQLNVFAGVEKLEVNIGEVQSFLQDN
jgi:hypothetical protein